jgi:FAD:protein FMN transferase
VTEPRRREFLRPDKLLQSVDKLGRDLLESATKIERWASTPVVSLKRPAMACQFEVQFAADERERSAAMRAFADIDDLEAQMTVYRDDSDLSRINAGAYPDPMRVEPLLFALLTRCERMTRETEGAFDITAGPLIRAWGFRRRQGREPDPDELQLVLDRVGMSKVAFDHDRRTVCFDRFGMELNLGAVGKGYALDRVAPRFKHAGYRGVLLGAGRSSVLGAGRPAWDDAWRVDVLHPMDQERGLFRVALRDQGLSTSGVSEQFFESHGRRLGHVIDPRSGQPVEGMLQVTVVAPDATQAEALSTAFFVNGVDWARRYCNDHPNIGAVVIPDPGPNRAIQPVTLGGIKLTWLKA